MRRTSLFGEPVRIEVELTDVIHSFWAPRSATRSTSFPARPTGPGSRRIRPASIGGSAPNIAASSMHIWASSSSPSCARQFRSWRDAQLQTAASTNSAGEALFVARCGACHTVRGTRAWGMFGPDLTHLMSRGGIAANTLPNTPANLSGWIADPQRIKPGAKMPMLALSAPELSVIRDYLKTLK